MDPMQPFLAGWLAACLCQDGPQAFKIAGITHGPESRLSELDVHLESGLVLRVSVTVVKEAADDRSPPPA